jgi:hypothetical protein
MLKIVKTFEKVIYYPSPYFAGNGTFGAIAAK